MLLSGERLKGAFEKIVADALLASAATAVTIMVAPDADAICAARILTVCSRSHCRTRPVGAMPYCWAIPTEFTPSSQKLLSSSNVLFRIVPVGGYTDVKELAEEAGEGVRGDSETLSTLGIIVSACVSSSPPRCCCCYNNSSCSCVRSC